MSQKEWTLHALTSLFSKREVSPIYKIRYFAIMVLLTEKNGELCFVLNKRAQGIKQGGDICFPGGHREKNETLKQTAFRETEEELGIPKDSITLIGKSDYLLTVYRGYIQPYIGFVPYQVLRESVINCDEVAEVFTVPLNFFLTTPPEIHYLSWEVASSDTFPYDRIEGGKNYPFSRDEVPELFYSYKGHTIWGMTAQIIQNMIEIMFQKEENEQL